MKTCMMLALLAVSSVFVASEVSEENNNVVIQMKAGGIVQLSQRIDDGSLFHYALRNKHGSYAGGKGKQQKETERFSPKQAKELFTKLQELREQQQKEKMDSLTPG